MEKHTDRETLVYSFKMKNIDNCQHCAQMPPVAFVTEIALSVFVNGLKPVPKDDNSCINEQIVHVTINTVGVRIL